MSTRELPPQIVLEKTYNCRRLKYVSICLQVIGMLTALFIGLNAISISKLHTPAFFNEWIYPYIKIFFVMVLFLAVLQTIYEKMGYSQLRIWKDADSDGITDSGELITLSDAGVQSINTGYTSSTTVDANDNQHLQTGAFTKADGATAAVTDVWFKMDAMYSAPKEMLEENEAIAALPDLQGYGNVYSLHDALKGLVQQFAVADGYVSKERGAA